MLRAWSHKRSFTRAVTVARAGRFSSTSSEKLFDKVLIANRGEIACRIMRTCKRLGIKTVAVYSEADAQSVHVKMADEAYCVGPAATNQSYLKMDNILDAVIRSKAQAVHPGYGFLSENRDFAAELEKNNVKFVGPRSEAITRMADKIGCKTVAKEAKVSSIPGYLGVIQNDDHLIKVAREIGYPVMIKAVHGGGGKGMRIAWNDKEAVEGFRLSTAEAITSFGNSEIFVEKYIEQPRHIEIQVLGDSHGNVVYLNERECTIQRRNQKVIEEAPSTFLDPATRRAMGEQAVRLAKAVNYESAGTCEFLVDKHRNFYFLEMNTRLQVEHPITEQITGLDLVEQMLRVAAGQKLAFTQDQIGINGWALEARVYAEDPLRGFLPSIGRLKTYKEPSGEGIRVDTGIREGGEISIYYDPMICKLVTFAPTRDVALQKMRDALDSYVIRGVTHNINFLRSLCDHPRFIKGDMTTAFIPQEYPNGYQGHILTDEDREFLVGSAVAVAAQKLLSQTSVSGQLSSFQRDAYYNEKVKLMYILLGEQQYRVDVTVACPDYQLVITPLQDGKPTGEGLKYTMSSTYSRGDIVFSTLVNGKKQVMQIIAAEDGTTGMSFQYKGTKFSLNVYTPREFELSKHMLKQQAIDSSKVLMSPMPGAVYSIAVQKGDTVVPGQEICVVEAMKMQNSLRAAAPGKVKSVNVKKGETVHADQILVEFE